MAHGHQFFTDIQLLKLPHIWKVAVTTAIWHRWLHCPFPAPGFPGLVQGWGARSMMKPSKASAIRLTLTLFYTRGLGIVVSHVMVPLPYRLSLGFFK
jgi:hypothetical protein